MTHLHQLSPTGVLQARRRRAVKLQHPGTRGRDAHEHDESIHQVCQRVHERAPVLLAATDGLVCLLPLLQLLLLLVTAARKCRSRLCILCF